MPPTPAKPMVLHKSSSKIERDEAEIDYSVAEMESAQGRVDRILEEKPKKKKTPCSQKPSSGIPCPVNENISSL